MVFPPSLVNHKRMQSVCSPLKCSYPAGTAWFPIHGSRCTPCLCRSVLRFGAQTSISSAKDGGIVHFFPDQVNNPTIRQSKNDRIFQGSASEL